MLKITGVRKKYNDFELDCSMELHPGMITGLIGKNGSGKSTTFKAILGIVKLDGGEISIFGKNVTELTADDRQKIGTAFADCGFSEYLTAAGIEKILKSMYTDFDDEYYLEKCRQFNIPMDKQLKDFSTGMRARMKVIIALSHHAKLLILDEPTVGLDVVARDAVLDMIREYMELHEDSAVIISSHISSDLESLCDDLYMIEGGRIILHEDTDVLLSDYALLKVSEEDYEKLDRQYLVQTKKEFFGYSCLTNQKQYYLENYPKITVQSSSIDDLIVMMNGGVQ